MSNINSRDDILKRGKIVLFYPVVDIRYMSIPLPLLAASRFLALDNYELVLIDGHDEDYEKKVINNVSDALCFCVTSMTGNQIEQGLSVSRIAKETNPDVSVIWGGWHPSILPEQTLSEESIDVVVIGYGERTLYEVVHKLDRDEPLDDVHGIAFKTEHGIVRNKDREPEALDSLPPIPYHLIDVERYLTQEGGNRTLGYISSFSCPNNCGFCADPLVYKRRWNPLSAQRMADEIEELVKEYDLDSIRIYDTNFFVSEERVAKFCQELIDRDIGIKWVQANGCADTIDRYKPETWRLMSESGCSPIVIGAESGSQEMLDLIGKKITPENLLRFQRKCNEYNIGLVCSFITGFPPISEKYESQFRQEFNNTTDILQKLIPNLSDDSWLLLFRYTPYPGSPMYALAERSGWQTPKNLEGWTDMNLQDVKTPWLNKKNRTMIDELRYFVMPTLCGVYTIPGLEAITPLLKIIHKLTRRIAKFRLDHKFFRFPIELYLILLIRKIRRERRHGKFNRTK